jgi:hypothetical protein
VRLTDLHACDDCSCRMVPSKLVMVVLGLRLHSCGPESTRGSSAIRKNPNPPGIPMIAQTSRMRGGLRPGSHSVSVVGTGFKRYVCRTHKRSQNDHIETTTYAPAGESALTNERGAQEAGHAVRGWR